MDPLVGEARGGVDGVQATESSGHPAGLFLELAPGDLLPGLAVPIGAAGGDLVDVAAGGVPELPEQHDLGVSGLGLPEDGDDGGGSGVADELELAVGAVGEADGVHGEVDDAAGVDQVRAQLPGLFGPDCIDAVRVDEPGLPGLAVATQGSVSWTSTGPRSSARSGASICPASPTTTMARRSGRTWSPATRRTSSRLTAAIRSRMVSK